MSGELAIVEGVVMQKTAIVFGAKIEDGRINIGGATALELSKAGWQVALVGRDQSKLTKVADQAQPGSIQTFAADLTSTPAIQQLFDELVENYKQIDGVVHTIGVYLDKVDATKMSDERWKSSLEINLLSAFDILRSAAGVMEQQKHGVLVGLSSRAGLHGHVLPGRADYSAAKHAYNGLMESIDKEMNAHSLPVRAYTVCPGLVHTPMTQKDEGGLEPIEVATAIQYLLCHPELKAEGNTFIIDRTINGGRLTHLRLIEGEPVE